MGGVGECWGRCADCDGEVLQQGDEEEAWDGAEDGVKD